MDGVLGVEAKPAQGRACDLSCTDSNSTQGHVKKQKHIGFSCLRETVNSMIQTSLHSKVPSLVMLDYDSSQLNRLCSVSISWREPPYCCEVYSWVLSGGPMTGQQRTILLGVYGSITWAPELFEISISFSSISANSASLLAHKCSSWQHCAVNFLHTNQSISQETRIALWAETCIFAVAACASSSPYFWEGSSDLSNIYCRIGKYCRI